MANRTYLKLGDLEGSITDKAHEKWVEVDSVSVGVSNAMNCVEKAQGNPGGEAHMHAPVAVTKKIDKLSPQLAVHCALGSGWDKAEIEVFEEQELLYKIALEKVALGSYDVSSSSEGVPTEAITINYAQIEYQYKDGAPDNFNLASDTASLEKKSFAKY